MNQGNVVDQEILEKVRAITCEKLGLKPGAVTATANFIYDLGAGSLDITEFVILVEEEFGVVIDDDKIDYHGITVEGLCALIQERLPETASA